MPLREPPDDFKLEPKVGFLGQPEYVLAYRKAREEPWFSQALIYALAQYAMRIPPEPGGFLLKGATDFIREFANLSVPDKPWPGAYKALRDETEKA
jgi:hypothetical protein